MAERPALVPFALGAFNVTVLMIAVLAFAASRGALGDLLEGLNTAVGLVLFAVLWLLTWWAGVAAMRTLTLRPPPRWVEVWVRGTTAGGMAGALVVVPPLLVGTSIALVTGSATDAPLTLALLLLYGAAAATVAFVVGASIGFVLATLDRALLAVVVLTEGPGVKVSAGSACHVRPDR